MLSALFTLIKMSESIRYIWIISLWSLWSCYYHSYHQPPQRNPRQSSSWRWPPPPPTSRHWPGPSLGPSWGSPECSVGAISAGWASPLSRPAWTRTSSCGCSWGASPRWGSLAHVWSPSHFTEERRTSYLITFLFVISSPAIIKISQIADSLKRFL